MTPPSGSAPPEQWEAAVDMLRRAADHLEPCDRGVTVGLLVPSGDDDGTLDRATFPAPVGRPIRGRLRAAAEEIERARSIVGLPVVYELQLAAELLHLKTGRIR